MGKPGDEGEYQSTANYLLLLPITKILLNKFTTSSIKSATILLHQIAIFISSPFTSLICSCNHCFVSFFFTSDFMYAHAILIFINQHCVKSVQIRGFFWSVFSRIWTEYGEILRISPYLLNVVFSITKALNGQSSAKHHFYYPHLSMLFGKLCFS